MASQSPDLTPIKICDGNFKSLKNKSLENAAKKKIANGIQVLIGLIFWKECLKKGKTNIHNRLLIFVSFCYCTDTYGYMIFA